MAASTLRTGSRPRSGAVLPIPVVLVSIVTVPILFGVLLTLGLILGLSGSIVRVTARRGSVLEKGTQVLRLGVALLVGPAMYVLLAVLRALLGY